MDRPVRRRDRVRIAAWSATFAICACLAFAGFVYEPPPSIGTLVGNARFELQLGLDDAARANLAAALERDPDNVEANLLMAVVHERAQEYAEALACYDRGRALIFAGSGKDPAEQARLEADFHVATGLLRLHEGDFGGAVADAERALARWPTSAGAFLIRAFSRLGGGDDTAFRQDLQRAYAADPFDPLFRLQRDFLAQAIPWASAMEITPAPGTLSGPQ